MWSARPLARPEAGIYFRSIVRWDRVVVVLAAREQGALFVYKAFLISIFLRLRRNNPVPQ